MNINLCETCAHWRECDRGKKACDLGFLDPALCGGHREERDSEHAIVARACDTLAKNKAPKGATFSREPAGSAT